MFGNLEVIILSTDSWEAKRIPGGEVPHQGVLTVPDAQLLVLSCSRDYFNQPSDLSLAVQRHGEELDSSVVDIVVGSNIQ